MENIGLLDKMLCIVSVLTSVLILFENIAGRNRK